MSFIRENLRKNIIITLIIDSQASVNIKLTCFPTIPAAKDVSCTIKTEIIKYLLSNSMLMRYITLLCTSLPRGSTLNSNRK